MSSESDQRQLNKASRPNKNTITRLGHLHVWIMKTREIDSHAQTATNDGPTMPTAELKVRE